MKRKSVLSAIMVFICAVFSVCYANVINFSLEPSVAGLDPVMGKYFTLNLRLTTAGQDVKISGFTFSIKYDDSTLTRIGTSKLTSRKNGSLKGTKYSKGTVNLEYNNDKTLFIAKNSKLDLCKFTFCPKIHVGTTDIHVTDVEAFDPQGNPMKESFEIPDLTLNVAAPSAASTCFLDSLEPSCGNLAPGFSPNIFEYQLDVPSDIKDVYFSARPSNPDTTVKISRHKLHAPGKSTKIFITTKNKTNKEELVYLVNVNRAPKIGVVKKCTNSSSKRRPRKSKNTTKSNANKSSKSKSCTTTSPSSPKRKNRSNANANMEAESQDGTLEDSYTEAPGSDRDNVETAEPDIDELGGESDLRDDEEPKEDEDTFLDVDIEHDDEKPNKLLFGLCLFAALCACSYSGYAVFDLAKSLDGKFVSCGRSK